MTSIETDSSDPDIQIRILTQAALGIGGGATEHKDLKGRELPDQHPIDAITELQEALDSKEPIGASANSVASHEARSDPHPQYLTHAEGNGAYDLKGTATSLVVLHQGEVGVHDISGVSGLQSALDGKSPLLHSHPLGDLPSNLATESEVATMISTHEGKPNAHQISSVNGLQTALNGKEALGTAISAIAAHEIKVGAHPISGIKDLQTALDGKEPIGTSAAMVTAHERKANAHPISGVSGLLSALEGKAPTSHTHTLSELPSSLATETDLNASIAAHQSKAGAHPISGVAGLQTILDGKEQVGVSIPRSLLTAKGDILTRNVNKEVRVPVGPNGSLLIADNTDANGFAWRNNVPFLQVGDESPSQVQESVMEVQGPGKGIEMRSPDGTRYLITIANGGFLQVVEAT